MTLIASVVTDIAFRNPRTYPYAISILGRVDSLLTKKESKKLFEKVTEKFSMVPNSEYLYIWLQRLSKNRTLKRFGFNTSLCGYVRAIYKNHSKNHASDIWNFLVCGDEVQSIFKSTPIIDTAKFELMTDYPMSDEIKVFQRYF